jgi:TPR repeat protein
LDITKAMQYYEKSAKQEDEEALLMLADIYEKGEGGINVDYEKAFRYLMKANERPIENIGDES